MALSTLKRILLVEDDPDIQAVARVALEAVGGFELAVCGSGAEALAKVPLMGPDLVLMDVMMPEMDGPSTLAALRRNAACSEVPVIFMTAKVQPSEVAHYRSLGAWDVIAKPFDPMSLSDQITTIWNAHST